MEQGNGIGLKHSKDIIRMEYTNSTLEYYTENIDSCTNNIDFRSTQKYGVPKLKTEQNQSHKSCQEMGTD